MFLTSVCQAQKITSIYTDLQPKKCKTLREAASDAEGYIEECSGTAGYKLRVLEGDLRQSINVITPRKKEFELSFWTFSSAFSRIGKKVEWHIKNKVPTALIVGFYAFENPDNPLIETRYLIVSKITENQICITDVVKPGANQNA